MVDNQKKPKHMLTGEVISDKMDKTIVVKVGRTFTDPFLKKTMHTSKKYKVHDESGLAKTGDLVEISEGRPKSKTKYMYLARIIKSIGSKEQ